MADDPYADLRDDSVPANLDTVLIQLADELTEANRIVEVKEAELEVAKDAARDIAEQRIPAATDGLQGKLALSDGRELIVKEEIRASIAGEKRIPAIQWMDDNDYGHIVKRQIIFEFGKGSEEEMKEFLEHVKAYIGPQPVMKQNFTVHPQTLIAWVKEQLGEGIALPKEVFGIFRQRTAKVKE